MKKIKGTQSGSAKLRQSGNRKTNNPSKGKNEIPRVAYRTKKGRMIQGLTENVLTSRLFNGVAGKVQLIFTSPPFPLRRKKRYGNLEGEEYIAWLSAFAPKFRELLTNDGSIVIEIGNAWEAGQPTMSTLPMETLLAFKQAANLHLCQEFICFNTARLPTPAQWVTIERTRVKDAFTRVWWLSPTPNPKANNKRVLTEYSKGMKSLLERGTYNPGKRPSEHRIGKKSFLKRHLGAIPPNVLVPSQRELSLELTEVLPLANTQSYDKYQDYCRVHNLQFHPARMPRKLVEFFIQFLTDKNDLVFDPFGGSNTTGAVSEELGRKWISIEPNLEYIKGSKGRFIKGKKSK